MYNVYLCVFEPENLWPLLSVFVGSASADDAGLKKINKLSLERWQAEKFQGSKSIWEALRYRVCHGFRLTNRDGYFRANFDHF